MIFPYIIIGVKYHIKGVSWWLLGSKPELNKKRNNKYKVEVIRDIIIYVHEITKDQLLELYYIVS